MALAIAVAEGGFDEDGQFEPHHANLFTPPNGIVLTDDVLRFVATGGAYVTVPFDRTVETEHGTVTVQFTVRVVTPTDDGTNVW